MDYFKLSKLQTVNTCKGIYSKALGEIWQGFAMNFSKLKTIETCKEFIFSFGNCAKPTLNDGDEYAVMIEKDGFVVISNDKFGLLRGIMTLIMRIENNPTASVIEPVIACGEVHGNFIVKERTLHTLAPTSAFFLQRLIRLSALLQYKILVVEFLSTYRYNCFPKSGCTQPIPKHTLKKLFKEANDLGLQIVPMVNSLGHASLGGVTSGKHFFLDKDPSLQPLFTPNGFSWNVQNPATIDMLRKMRKEMCELVDQSAFEQKYFHLGFDEGYIFRENYIDPQIVANFIKKLTDEVVEEGYIPFVWGDMLLDTKVIGNIDFKVDGFYQADCQFAETYLQAINKKSIICDWQYTHAIIPPVKTSKYLKEKGYKVYGSAWGGMGGWLDPRNVDVHVETFKQGYNDGLMLTMWGHKRDENLVHNAYQCGLPHNTYSKASRPDTLIATFYRKLLPSKGNMKISGFTL